MAVKIIKETGRYPRELYIGDKLFCNFEVGEDSKEYKIQDMYYSFSQEDCIVVLESTDGEIEEVTSGRLFNFIDLNKLKY